MLWGAVPVTGLINLIESFLYGRGNSQQRSASTTGFEFGAAGLTAGSTYGSRALIPGSCASLLPVAKRLVGVLLHDALSFLERHLGPEVRPWGEGHMEHFGTTSDGVRRTKRSG